MKKRILSLLLLAALAWALMLTAGAVDTSREATLYYRGIQITLDGRKITPTDATVVHDGDCSGYFFFDDSGVLRWSDREDCAFARTGEPDDAAAYVQVASPTGFAELNESTRGDYDLLAIIPNGTILAADFVSENWAYVYFGDFAMGYIPASDVSAVNFDPAGSSES